MDIVSLIVQLISGAVGGNLAGAALKNVSLGPVGNSIVGILGGGIGGQLLSMLVAGAATGGGLDAASIISSVASGGVGGGVLMAIIGLIRQQMVKS